MKYIRTRKQRFEVASSNVGRRVLVHALRSLEDAHGNVAAQEGEPFEKESTSMVHALEIVVTGEAIPADQSPSVPVRRCRTS